MPATASRFGSSMGTAQLARMPSSTATAGDRFGAGTRLRVVEEDLVALLGRAPGRQRRVHRDDRDLLVRVRGEVRRRDDAQLAAFEEPDQAVPRLGVDRGQRRDPIEHRFQTLAPRDHLEDPRLLGEEVVERFAFRDVADVEDDPVDRRVVEPVRDRGLLPVPALVGMAHPHERLGGLLGVLQHPRPRRADLRRIVGVHELAHEVADERGCVLPREPLVRRADVLAAGVEVEDDDAVGRVLHECAEPGLGGRDARRGLAPFGDVVHVDDDAFDHRVVELVRHRDLAPAQGAVAMLHPHVGAARSAVFEHPAADGGANALEVVGLDDHAGIAPADQVVDRVAREGLDRLGREDDHSGAIEHDDRVGRVREEAPEAVLAARERGCRNLSIARAHPDDAHHEHQSGGHQHRDPVAPAGAHDARRPTEPDRGLGAREAREAPHRRREHGRRTFERDGLRRAEDETDRQHRTPTGRVDHARRADDLQADSQAERQAPGRLPVGDRRAEREREDGDGDEHRDRHRCEDADGAQREQGREREDRHRHRFAQRPER